MGKIIEKLKKTEKEEPSIDGIENEEGEPAINLYETEDALILETALAGVDPQDLEIYLERDVLTIKGERKEPLKKPGKYLVKECFFGKFKREVILPAEGNPQGVKADFKNGFLRLEIPLLKREKSVKIKIEGT